MEKVGSDSSKISSEREPHSLAKIDLSRPRYDQSTYTGRAKHFFETVSPLNILVSKNRLSEAADLVKAHK